MRKADGGRLTEMRLTGKRGLLIGVAALMACVFCLTSCEFAGIELPFATEATTEASTPDAPADDGTTADTSSGTVTTTRPIVTTPAIENGGPNTEPGYGPIVTPVQ